MEKMSDLPNSVVKVETHISLYAWNDDVENVLNVADKLLQVGGFAFPEIIPIKESVKKVGDMIKGLIGKVVDKPDPVMEKLKELENKMDELSTKMAAHFADMKEFITEVNFLTTITVPTTNLMRFMQDCLDKPTKESSKNFESAYNDRKPIKIAYDLLSFLENEKTNPLKMAMAVDPLKTNTTFEKWVNKIAAILGQFLFLEAFASGLGILKIDEESDFDLLAKRSQELAKVMSALKDEYRKNQTYWPEAKKFAQDLVDKNTEKDNDFVADRLKEGLANILTNDWFYIIVNRGSENPGGFAESSERAKRINCFLLSTKRVHIMSLYIEAKWAWLWRRTSTTLWLGLPKGKLNSLCLQ